MSKKEKISAVAMRYLQRGQLDRAIKEYMRILADDPSDERTLQKVGDLHSRMGNTAEALKMYKQVSELYIKQGYYLKAIAVYKQILNLDPDDAKLHGKLGEMYEQMGLMPEAIQQYSKMGQYYREKKLYKDALDIYVKIRALDPGNLPNKIMLAETYFKLHRRDQGIMEFEAILSELKDSGRVNDYSKVLDRFLKHNPGDVARGRDLARYYLRKGNFKKALVRLQVALKGEPENLETLELLANAFVSIKQIPKGLTVYREIIRVLKKKNDKENLVKVYEAMLRLDPSDEKIQKELKTLRGKAAPTRSHEDTSALLQTLEPLETDLPPDPVHHEPVPASAPRQEFPQPYQQPNPELNTVPDHHPSMEKTLHGFPNYLEEPEPYTPPVQQPVPTPGVAGLPQQMQPTAHHFTQVPIPLDAMAEAGPMAEAPDEQVPTENDIQNLLLESDVFANYGLHAQSEDALQTILEYFPDHEIALLRLKNLYTVTFSEPDINRVALHLAAIYLEQQRLKEAKSVLSDAAELNYDQAQSAMFRDKVGHADSLKLAGQLRELVQSDLNVDWDDANVDLNQQQKEAPDIEIKPMYASADLQDDETFPPPFEGELAPPSGDLDQELLLDFDDEEEDLSIEEQPVLGKALPTQQTLEDKTPAPPTPKEMYREAKFFAFQGLFEEAINIAHELLEQDPGMRKAQRAAENWAGSLAMSFNLPLYVPPETKKEPAPQAASPAQSQSVVLQISEADMDPELLAKLSMGEDPEKILSEERQKREPAPPKKETAVPKESKPDEAAKPSEKEGESGYFNLAEEIWDDLEESDFDSLLGSPEPAKEMSQTGEEDHVTHYNLGLAYREMEMLDDAISEFLQVWNVEPSVDSGMQLALCYVQKGNIQRAAHFLKQTIACQDIAQEDIKKVRYELGEIYIAMGNPARAYYYFQSIITLDPTFLDVQDRISVLMSEGITPDVKPDQISSLLKSFNYHDASVNRQRHNDYNAN